MSKAIIFNASPRPKGNCAAIASRMEEELAEKGFDVRRVDFRTATIGYCKGCDACKRHDEPWCVQKDDMGALLPELDAADCLVMLTPIYWGDITAQAKTFVDRMYAFFAPAKESMTVATKFGKKVAVVTTSGSMPVEAVAEKTQAVINSLGIAGYTEGRSLSLNQLNVPGAVNDSEEYLAEVDELVGWLSE